MAGVAEAFVDVSAGLAIARPSVSARTFMVARSKPIAGRRFRVTVIFLLAADATNGFAQLSTESHYICIIPHGVIVVCARHLHGSRTVAPESVRVRKASRPVLARVARTFIDVDIAVATAVRAEPRSARAPIRVYVISACGPVLARCTVALIDV